ncbi:MAG TPA: hypothetical protein VFI24_25435 [Pyrinomonadaceae bacterium]|nr:hypothetical protein [Pyrinomonadaceae bacterium]
MKETCIFLCFLLSATVTHAQTKQAAPAKVAAANSAASEEAELELKERRAKARALLISLSSDARAFHDQMLRARSLARIADTLWRVDTEQGRLLFRKAWEAAEVADQESDKKLQEEISKQKALTGGGYAINLPPNVRQEVLRLAARHDRVLGEEFLEKLKAQKLEAANSATTAKPNPNRLNEAMSQRIGVASQLLQAGETDRALEFAEPALALVTTQTINFLTEAREKNADAADKRYAGLLTIAGNNPQADANTVSLLASYIFTPHLMVTFSGSGMSSSQSSDTITPAIVSPELRNAFFQIGGAILLRPLAAPGQPDQTSAGIDGKYLAIKRMLPFFEQGGAPAETIESLRTHLNALSTVVSDDTRKRDDDWINRGLKTEKPAADREQSVLERIDRAKTSAERDQLYIELAYITSNKGEIRARDYVGKIEDSEVRKQLQAYIDPSLAMFYINKKNTDQALEMVHKGELTHIQKTWALSKCAMLLAKTDRDKALEIIGEAEAEARRIEGSDPSLARGLIAVANAYKEVDPSRVWDATFDAVKAANSAEGFTGEDGEMVLKFQSKGQSSVHSSDVPEFDLDGIFKELAAKDYDRAVELARGFQAEGPRAVATIAIARAILEPKRR